MPQSLAKLHIHLIFSTKNRQRLLSDDIRPEFHAYSATVLANLNCPATIINSVEDHVHILFDLNRTVAVAKAVEDIKKSSSKWLKTRTPELSEFSWQAGYGAFSVSESQVLTVRRYIENQAEHHRTQTFQEEYIAFLEKHGIEHDTQYLWD